MHARTMFSLLTLALLGLPAAEAQDLPIDDFSTGPYRSAEFFGGTHSSNQNGTMLGGNRSTSMFVCPSPCGGANPFFQAVSYTFQPATKIAPSAFIQSAGYGTAPRIDMGYGFGAPMQVDLSPYDRIRLNFLGLTEALNFNIQLFTGGAYAQGGCNLGAYAGVFSVELPLSAFVTTHGFNQGDITYVDLIFQSSSAVGSVNFAITSVEASNTATPGAISCHY